MVTKYKRKHANTGILTARESYMFLDKIAEIIMITVNMESGRVNGFVRIIIFF
jgi:hypothetical protein